MFLNIPLGQYRHQVATVWAAVQAKLATVILTAPHSKIMNYIGWVNKVKPCGRTQGDEPVHAVWYSPPSLRHGPVDRAQFPPHCVVNRATSVQALWGFDIHPAKLGIKQVPMLIHVLIGGRPPQDEVAAKFSKHDLRANPANHS
jgi:hypothetical protein